MCLYYNDKNVDLTFIIPVHNSKDFIKQSIESIIKYRFDFSYEIIIVDDKSSDGSLLTLNEYCNLYDNIFNFVRLFSTKKLVKL